MKKEETAGTQYTAQEMREMATVVFDGSDFQDDGCTVVYRDIYCGKYRFHPSTVARMLRQAADAEEELAELRDLVNRDFGESVSLKSRLEAVVKIAESRDKWFSCRNCARDFLRAARGEKGKTGKETR